MCALTIDEATDPGGILPFFHIYGMVVIMNCGLYAGSTIVTMRRFISSSVCKSWSSTELLTRTSCRRLCWRSRRARPVDKYDLCITSTPSSGSGTPRPADRPSQRGVWAAAAPGLRTDRNIPCDSRYGSRQPGEPREHRPARAKHRGRVVDVVTGAAGPARWRNMHRGPQVTKGCLNRPDATAGIIDAMAAPQRRYRLCRRERLSFIVDRLKELIKYKGMQIAPAELEADPASRIRRPPTPRHPRANEDCGQAEGVRRLAR